jgi:hypothetical protein
MKAYQMPTDSVTPLISNRNKPKGLIRAIWTANIWTKTVSSLSTHYLRSFITVTHVGSMRMTCLMQTTTWPPDRERERRKGRGTTFHYPLCTKIKRFSKLTSIRPVHTRALTCMGQKTCWFKKTFRGLLVLNDGPARLKRIKGSLCSQCARYSTLQRLLDF